MYFGSMLKINQQILDATFFLTKIKKVAKYKKDAILFKCESMTFAYFSFIIPFAVKIINYMQILA